VYGFILYFAHVSWTQIALTSKSLDMGWAVRVSFSVTTSGVDMKATLFPSDHTDNFREAEVTGASN
jgi:hypothetical protein